MLPLYVLNNVIGLIKTFEDFEDFERSSGKYGND